MAENVKDRNKIEQGLSRQTKAEIAFNAHDMEEAFYLYIEAEKLFREGFEFPGDRVFFMQSRALRTLKELLETGRLDFYDIYQEKANAFFEEWTEAKINTRITYHRRGEAFDFRVWRAPYLKVCPEFYDANAAIERGHFPEARQILDQFISKLESKLSPESESDALCAIARSKREIITVKEQLKKREDQRDISVIADAYMRAAEVSQLPENSASQQRQRIEAFRDWFLSFALKFKAFSWLRDEKMTNPMLSLNEAEQLLVKAAEHAERAISSPSGVDFPQSHYSYLRFWHAIISERLHLLKFMKTGKEEDFKLCIQAWREALTIAEEFLKQDSEESIFPNRFYSLRDIELEEIFLKAAYAFRQQKWGDCATYLEEWQEKFPQEFHWSWRHIQVYIRLCFAKALCAFSEGNQQELRGICKELERKAKPEPIGNVGQLLVAETQGLQKGISLNDEYVNLICAYFPLDSYCDSYQPASDIDPLLSLPQRIYNWLVTTSLPSTNVEVAEFRARVLGCIEALVGYILDYHLQVFLPNEPVHRQDLGLHALFERFSDLAKIYWKERRSLIVSIENLKKATSYLPQVTEPDEYKSVHQSIYGTLKGLSRIVPVIIDIKSVTYFVEELKSIKAFPDWMLHLSRRGREEILISADPEIFLDPCKYYLPPDWRKGNRVSYGVSESQPLLRVRYEPRWWFWEQEAANASLLLIEGISFKHLEKAIELAENSTPEDERVHPKVGAVIVKDDGIISRAYRNEDDKGGHAEQLAIEKCHEEDLKGATIITTLEPCIKRGHRFNRSCAEMIVYYGLRKVVIGLLDPNRKVRGKGELLLRQPQNKIAVAHFTSTLSLKIYESNENYIKTHTNDEFKVISLYDPFKKNAF